MIDIDEVSQLAKVETDETLPAIERQLNQQGFTLNYRAVPKNDVLLVEALQQRLPNLYHQAYGGLEELCLQLHLVQSNGHSYQNVLAPRSATGPSLKNIAIGGGKALGIPIEATLRIFPKPEHEAVAVMVFPGERQRDYFLQSIKKHDIPVPLLAPLKQQKVQNYFPSLDEEAILLGLSLWGTIHWVEHHAGWLQKMAEQKMGEWLSLAGGSEKEALRRLVQKEAIAGQQQAIQTAQEQINVNHLNLMKRIKKY